MNSATGARANFGEVSITDAARIWTYIDAYLPRIELADENHRRNRTALTARTFDEVQAAGKRTYIVCSQLLASALDHHNALKFLLLSDHGVTPHAHWTLMRTIYEESMLIHWILEPTIGDERRRRGLRRSVLDQKQYELFQSSAVASVEGAVQVSTQNAKATATYHKEPRSLAVLGIRQPGSWRWFRHCRRSM